MIVGVGVDVVDVPRVQKMVDRFGDTLLARLFTAGERRYAMARTIPAPSLAVRVAAKEAGYKALAGNSLARAIGWLEMEVVNGPDGAPALLFHGRAAERAAELQVSRVHISLSHSHASAVAMVVLERD